MTEKMIHKFEIAGLGKAPFKLVGMYSLPSSALAEQNPSAYNNALSMMPKDVACGSCAYCGMSLMHNFIVKSADNRKFVVGCDCVSKIGDTQLVDAINLKKRQVRQAERLQQREAERLARLDAERLANDGLTNVEVEAAKRDAWLAKRAPLEKSILETLRPILCVLDANSSDFTRMICYRLRGLDLDLSRGMVSIMLEIAAKSAGRKNSKSYNEKLDEVAALWDKATEIHKSLPSLAEALASPLIKS